MLKKILKKDKLLHLSAGFMIACLTTMLTKHWWLILLIPTIIGIVKELVWDKWWKQGTPEWLDAVATALGAVVWLILNR